MFGYVMINKELLSEGEQARFRAFYCGLCRALGQRHGQAGRLTLSFDMTFLAMLLSSLYDPETIAGDGRCIVHPSKRHAYVENPLIHYAADMTIAMAYHKAMDDWLDERSIIAHSQARALRGRYRQVEALYPRQCAAAEQGMSELRGLEKKKCAEIDPPANAFGRMLGELFVYHKDMWADTLRTMGAAMGRFIYLMDAYDDLESDRRKAQYNPLIALGDQPGFEDKCKRYLMLFIGEGTVAFEQLPIVEDIGILRNILYSGIWTRYQCVRRKREEKGAKA